MDNINNRFKILRKFCGKTQSDFGRVLGISTSGIADIENGRRNVTEKHLIMLSNWNEYNVNIDWLRTGEGDMLLPTETDALELIRQEYNLTDIQLKFVANYLRLPENEKDIIFDFLSSVFNEQSETMDSKIHKELHAYQTDLELEARQAAKSSVYESHVEDSEKEVL